MKGGSLDANILTAQLIADKASEWGGQIWYRKVDLFDAFGSITPMFGKNLRTRMGAQAARDNHGPLPGSQLE